VSGCRAAANLVADGDIPPLTHRPVDHLARTLPDARTVVPGHILPSPSLPPGRSAPEPGRDDLAADELEEKNVRKRAVVTLASGGVDPDVALDLLSSDEQGVQRLAAEHLADLYRERPADPEFLAQCVQTANTAEDVGIGRRLIPVLLDLDLVAGISALSPLSVAESGRVAGSPKALSCVMTRSSPKT
jgi:hypothetical protein